MSKTPIKLKFAGFWTDSATLNKRMIENWGSPPECFELTAGDDFDFLVSFSWSKEMNRTPRDKNIAVTMEPSWSHNSVKSLPSACKYVITSDKEIQGDNVFHEYTFMLHHDSRNNHETSYKSGGSPSDYLSVKDFPHEIDFSSYPKKLSMFIANHGTLAGAPSPRNSLYKVRENLLYQILKSDLNIDIFGIGWNIEDSRYKGPTNLKSEGLKGYKYSICFENSREDLYLSEKFIDVFLNNCVPIYWGCRNISKAYPVDSFVEFEPDHPDPIRFLKDQIEKPVKPRNSSIQKAKQMYFYKYNLFLYLEKLLS